MTKVTITLDLTDPDPGFTGFAVQRITYRLQNGASLPAMQMLPVSINVTAAGTDPETVGKSVYDVAEQYLLRTLRGAM